MLGQRRMIEGRRRSRFFVLVAFVLLHASGCARNPYRVTIDAEPLIRALGSDDLFESDPAEDKLLSLGPAAVPLLAKALEREPANVRVGVVGVLDLLRLPEAAPLLLSAAANDADEEVRADAVLALDNVKDPHRRQVIEAALGDPSPLVRVAAIQLCATLCSSPAALDRLVQIAISDQQPRTGGWARLSLAMMINQDAKSARATDARAAVERRARPLLGATSSLEARARAALLIAELGDRAAAPVLVQAVRDEGARPYRLHAAYALGEVGDAAAVPVLAELLGGDPTTAAYGADALRKLADKGIPGAAAALEGFSGPLLPHGLPRPPP